MTVPLTLTPEEVGVERVPFSGNLDPDTAQHAFQGGHRRAGGGAHARGL